MDHKNNPADILKDLAPDTDDNLVAKLREFCGQMVTTTIEPPTQIVFAHVWFNTATRESKLWSGHEWLAPEEFARQFPKYAHLAAPLKI